MSAILILIFSILFLLFAYQYYGSFLERIVFKCKKHSIVPSHKFADGKEFVASSKSVMFGHHFTSIAGTGPIVGPAIGVIWGWLPAVLWVLFGSIFLGAVHDFSILMISIRNKGQSIAQLSEIYLGSKLKYAFFAIICLSLWIVIAIFALIMGLIFAQFPSSVLAIWFEIPIAILMGYWVFKRNGNLFIATIVSVLLMYLFVYLGQVFPISLPNFQSIPSSGLWALILLLYAFIAALLPVSTLLQPRDYLNAWQLYIAIIAIVLGILSIAISGNPLLMHAPAVNFTPNEAPSIWPFLCITIACGAISGFHSLVCSGTSSKQISSEMDAKAVGYGSMLAEAFLAVLIIIAVCAGLTLSYTNLSGETFSGISAWNHHYHSWTASAGLSSKINAVVNGCANFLISIGLSKGFAVATIGVLIASFAGTTLDSATRVQRYIISELLQNSPLKRFSTPLISTSIAVLSALLLAFSSGFNGKGALSLWPLFGCVNQVLAAIAFCLISIYLKKTNPRYTFLALIPCVLLLILTFYALLINQWTFYQQNNILLFLINAGIMILALWISIASFFKIFYHSKSNISASINHEPLYQAFTNKTSKI